MGFVTTTNEEKTHKWRKNPQMKKKPTNEEKTHKWNKKPTNEIKNPQMKWRKNPQMKWNKKTHKWNEIKKTTNETK